MRGATDDDQDRPQRFVSSAIWELPFGRGRKFLNGMPAVANTFLGDWQIEGIYTGQSGPPLSWGNVLFLGDRRGFHVPRSGTVAALAIDALGQRAAGRWVAVAAEQTGLISQTREIRRGG